MKRRICSQRENVFVVVVVVHHRPSPMPFFCFSFFALSPPLSHALFPPTCHSPTYLPRIRIGDLPASGAHHALGHGRRCRRHAPDDARAPEPDGRHYVSWKKIMLEVVSRCFCLFLRTCVENRQGTKRPRRIGGNETSKGRENRARNASFFCSSSNAALDRSFSSSRPHHLIPQTNNSSTATTPTPTSSSPRATTPSAPSHTSSSPEAASSTPLLYVWRS